MCKGSSGGAVLLAGSKGLIGMHVESLNSCLDYEEADAPHMYVDNDKLVKSEDRPYPKFTHQITQPPKKSKHEVDSESIKSLFGGTNGLGSALIVSRHSKLMKYISELLLKHKGMLSTSSNDTAVSGSSA